MLARILDEFLELLVGHAAGIHFVVVRADKRHKAVVLLLQYQRLQHERHVIDFRLNLFGVDILPARTEKHRFAASLDIQESVFVQHS